MGTLKFSLKAIEDAQWSDKEGVLEFLLDSALKYEHFSAIEGAPDKSPEGTLHLRLKLRVHLRLQLSCTWRRTRVYESAQNDSIKGELDEKLAPEGVPKIWF